MNDKEYMNRDEDYWFLSYLGLEGKQNRKNRAILTFRYWNGCKGESKQVTVYSHQNIFLPTGFIHNSDFKKIDQVKTVWGQSGLPKHSLIQHKTGNYIVFQADLPFDPQLIEQQPSSFQKGGYEKLFRFRFPHIDDKCLLSPELEDVLIQKQALNHLQEKLEDLVSSAHYFKAATKALYSNLLSGETSPGPQYKSDPLAYFNKKFPSDQSRIKELVISFKNRLNQAQNSLAQLGQGQSHFYLDYNPESRAFEVNLGSLESFLGKDFSGEEKISFTNHLSAQEVRQQVICFGDLEKPLFKSQGEKRYLGIRKRLLKNLKQGLYQERQKEKGRRVLAAVEKRLTKTIAGLEIKLFDSDYDSKISWFPLLFQYEDGSEEKELHTLYELNADEVNGYSVVIHQTEEELVEAVIRSMKSKNAFVFVGHNLPYDITQTRFAADSFALDMEIGAENKNPKRDVVRDFYQRMKEESLIYFDTCRVAINFHPFLRAKRPPGSHKLVDFCHYLGIEFSKSLTYDEMRELEVLAIDGNREAMVRLAHYATSDVEPLKQIWERKYLEVLMEVKKKLPFCTLTQVAFSPQTISHLADSYHFNQSGNHPFFGYKQKMKRDEIDIFKKRFNSVNRDMFKHFGIDKFVEHGFQGRAFQLYLPLELWIRPAFEFEQFWQDYFALWDNWPSDWPQELKLGFLQFPRAYLINQILPDYYFYRKESKEYLDYSDKLDSKVKGLIKQLAKDNHPSLFKTFASIYNHLKNHYRSVYMAMPGQARKLVRKTKKIKEEAQKKIEDFDFFTPENIDLILLRDKAQAISPLLSTGQRPQLKRYLTLFNKSLTDVIEDLQQATGIEDFEYARSLLYLHTLQERVAKKRKKFKIKHSLEPDGPHGLSQLLADGFERAAALLQQSLDLVELRGNSLFVTADNPESVSQEELGNLFLFIRDVPEFWVK